MRWWGWVTLVLTILICWALKQSIIGTATSFWEDWKNNTERPLWLMGFAFGASVLGLTFMLIFGTALGKWDLSDRKPDGCYRLATAWNPATKTYQTTYSSIPCPEER